MENEIKIVDALPEDAVGIRLVQKDTWLATYPNPEMGITKEDVEAKIEEMQNEGLERLVKRLQEDKNSHTWVAKDNDKVIGFIGALKRERENEIKAIYVLSNYQGKGIGKKLMNKALDYLGNGKDISLSVVNYNLNAINFYKSFGFIEDGEITEDIALLPSGARMPEIRMVLKSN